MRLLANADTPGFDINVDARDGVVTLFGVVDSSETKRQAEAEVRKVEGVRSVRNDLQVVPPVVVVDVAGQGAEDDEDDEDEEREQSQAGRDGVAVDGAGDADGASQPDGGRRREPFDVAAALDDGASAEEADSAGDALDHLRDVHLHVPFAATALGEAQRGRDEARGAERHQHVCAQSRRLAAPLALPPDAGTECDRKQEPLEIAGEASELGHQRGASPTPVAHPAAGASLAGNDSRDASSTPSSALARWWARRQWSQQ